MSALAGIVRLSASGGIRQDDVERMLRAMATSPADTTEVLAGATGFAAIGRIRYGTDADLPAAVAAAARLCMIGELYNAEAGNHAAQPGILLARYRSTPIEDFPGGLNGSFSAAVLDEQNQSITLLTDHMNSCPLFVREHEGLLYFASEVKALTALPHLPCRANEGMILSLLTNDQFMNLQTAVEGITQLDCATTYTAGPGVRRQHQAWRYAIDDQPTDLGRRQALEALSAALRQAVDGQVRLDDPAILLSGGQDARTIVSFMSDPARMTAYTYTARSADERHRFGDASCAAELARVAGLKHVLLQFDPSPVLQLIRRSVAQSDGAAMFLREDIWDTLREQHGVRFVLIGDECFSATSGPLVEANILEYLGLHCLHEIPSLWAFIRRDRFEEFAQRSRAEHARLFPPGSGRPAHNILNELLHRQRLYHFHNPKRRMIARHGIQVRRPLLDLSVLSEIGHIPFRYMVGKELVQQAMDRARPDIASLPRARATETVTYDRAFTELERQGGQVSAFLFEDNPLMGEYFNLEAVRQLVADVTSGQAPPRRGRFEGLLPPQVRRWMAAIARRYFHLRAPYLTGRSARLLRILSVAEVLRHVARRCPPTTLFSK